MLRSASTGIADVLGTSHNVTVKADMWLNGTLLANDLPILNGSLSEAADQAVPETLALTIAAADADGRSFIPGSNRGRNAVVGSDGHRLRVVYNIDRGGGKILSCPLGWFRVDSWSLSGGQIDLQSSGLLSVINDYKLQTPTSPAAGATLSSEIRRLVAGALPVSVAASGDRSASKTLAWTEDRLGALYDLADAWPADLRVDANGTLWVSDIANDSNYDLVLFESDYVIESTDGGSRDGVSNIVVARGEDSGDPNRAPVQAIARDTNPASPTNISDYGPVVSIFSSPLLTTIGAAQKAANTQLAKVKAQSNTLSVSILPDPRIAFGTHVKLYRADGRAMLTTVLNSSLPLTAAGGSQSLTLGILQ